MAARANAGELVARFVGDATSFVDAATKTKQAARESAVAVREETAAIKERNAATREAAAAPVPRIAPVDPAIVAEAYRRYAASTAVQPVDTASAASFVTAARAGKTVSALRASSPTITQQAPQAAAHPPTIAPAVIESKKNVAAWLSLADRMKINPDLLVGENEDVSDPELAKRIQKFVQTGESQAGGGGKPPRGRGRGGGGGGGGEPPGFFGSMGAGFKGSIGMSEHHPFWQSIKQGAGMAIGAMPIVALAKTIEAAGNLAARGITSLLSALNPMNLAYTFQYIRQSVASVAEMTGMLDAAKHQAKMLAFEGSMTATGGFVQGAGAAKKVIEDLEKLVGKTPWAMDNLEDVASRLNVIGVQQHRIVPLMKEIFNIAAGTGRGAEGLMAVAEAFGEMEREGGLTVSAIMKLDSLGLPAIKRLSVGSYSGKEALDALSMGARSSLTDVYRLKSVLGDAFPDAANKMSKSLIGIYTGLIDFKNRMVRQFGEILIDYFQIGPVMENIKKKLGEVWDAFRKGWAEGGKGGNWGGAVKEGITSALEALFDTESARRIVQVWEGFIDSIREIFTRISNLFRDWFKDDTGTQPLKTWTARLIETLGEFATGFNKVIGSIISFIEKLPHYFKLFQAHFKDFMAEISEAKAGMYDIMGFLKTGEESDKAYGKASDERFKAITLRSQAADETKREEEALAFVDWANSPGMLEKLRKGEAGYVGGKLVDFTKIQGFKPPEKPPGIMQELGILPEGAPPPGGTFGPKPTPTPEGTIYNPKTGKSYVFGKGGVTEAQGQFVTSGQIDKMGPLPPGFSVRTRDGAPVDLGSGNLNWREKEWQARNIIGGQETLDVQKQMLSELQKGLVIRGMSMLPSPPVVTSPANPYPYSTMSGSGVEDRLRNEQLILAAKQAQEERTKPREVAYYTSGRAVYVAGW